MKNKKLYIYLIFFVLFSDISFAYLDPGMISIFLQGMVAAIAATSSFIFLYWSKIIKFIKNKMKKNNEK